MSRSHSGSALLQLLSKDERKYQFVVLPLPSVLPSLFALARCNVVYFLPVIFAIALCLVLSLSLWRAGWHHLFSYFFFKKLMKFSFSLSITLIEPQTNRMPFFMPSILVDRKVSRNFSLGVGWDCGRLNVIGRLMINWKTNRSRSIFEYQSSRSLRSCSMIWSWPLFISSPRNMSHSIRSQPSRKSDQSTNLPRMSNRVSCGHYLGKID